MNEELCPQNNCGKNLEKAYQKIANDSRFKPTTCMGPQGPRGPQGPATITIGTTTTGLPGTEATVTNSGTDQDVILNFVIPEGATGPQGPQGPQGDNEPISSILTVNETSNEVATNTLVPLGTEVNSTGTAFTYTAPDTITINEAGTYLIDFSSLVSSTDPTTGQIGATLQINGTTIPTASSYIPATTIPLATIELKHNYEASVGDIITVTNTNAVSNNYQGTNLSIIKLL